MTEQKARKLVASLTEDQKKKLLELLEAIK